MIISETATNYLNNLTDNKRNSQQSGILHFVMWYGANKNMASITAGSLNKYVEATAKNGKNANANIEAVKKFLTYAFNNGLTKENMALYIKNKRLAKSGNQNTQNKDNKKSITQQGYDSLVTELERLRKIRSETVEQITIAAADKDLRENAPYAAAKERCGIIEGQIIEIEDMLKHSYIIGEEDREHGKVNMGDTVTVLDEKNNKNMSFTLVSTKEIDMSCGKISVDSPIGCAILGGKVGAKVQVNAPAGTFYFKIIKIN
ncbi:MAG: GreA/GreB family elongation factor [Chloroflexi bacterium]|nr:GreA/GreB family elongation factor [Chloroflexota bacterium]